MNCPVDATPLQMSERQGIEIDYCPQCRGVWLDRGELDKIIERAAPAPAPVPPRDDRRDDRRDERRYDDRDRRDDGGGGYGGYGKKRKKESFLGELFDFG